MPVSKHANWSVKLEYLHIRLGSGTTAFPIVTPAAVTVATSTSTSDELANNVARIGVNYRV